MPGLVVGRGELGGGGELVEARQGVFDVGRDGELDALVLVVLGGVDVDVDDGRAGGEFVDIAGDSVVEAGAEAEEEVGLVHGPVAEGGAVHAKPAEGERVVLGEGTDAHEGGGDGDVDLLGEGAEVGRGLGGDDAAAGVDDGAVGLGDEVEDVLQLLVAGVGELGEGLVGELDRGGEDRGEFGLLDVLRNVDDDGAGAAGAGEDEGLLEDAREVGGVEDEVAVFDDRQGHAEEVGLLERGLADELGENLAGDTDQRDGVHVGIGDAGNEVGGSGAGGGHAHADFAVGAGPGLGGEHTALLVAGKDDADFVAAGEGLVELLRGTAGVGEDDVHALTREALDYGVGAVHGATDFGLGEGGGRGGGFHGVVGKRTGLRGARARETSR